jgi:hypothetical protein
VDHTDRGSGREEASVRAESVAVVCFLAGAGCSKTVAGGGLEVLIATNLATPVDFDSIAVTVSQETPSGGWTVLFQNTFLVPSEASLPTSFSIAAGSSASQVALVQVTALKAGNPIDLREAEVQVPTDRVAELTMILAESCVGQVTIDNDEPAATCPMGQSCQPATGACGPTRITTPLPTYNPGDLQHIDASVGSALRDATLPPDSGHPRHDAGHPHHDAGHDSGHVEHHDSGPAEASTPGDACLQGCTPIAIDNSGGAIAVAADDARVYWCVPREDGYSDGGQIVSAPFDGGPYSLFANVGNCAGVAVDDGYVYWTDPAAGAVVKKAKADGGKEVNLATGQVQVAAIAVDSTHAYWTSNGGLSRVPLSGSGTKALSSLCRGSPLLTLDDSSAYCLSCPTYVCGIAGVAVVPLAGADADTIIDTDGQPSGFAVLGGEVYVAYNASNSETIAASPPPGARGLDASFTQQSFPTAMIADTKYVYWTLSITGTGLVAGEPGHSPVTLAIARDGYLSNTSPPFPIAQNATSVFWGISGEIVMTPKPH